MSVIVVTTIGAGTVTIEPVEAPGSISLDGRSGGSVSLEGNSPGSISVDGGSTYYGEISLKGGGGSRFPEYNGPTTILPERDLMQILPTKDTLVRESIVALPVPYSETINESGGTTVCIGG